MTWRVEYRIEYPAAPHCECGDGDKHNVFMGFNLSRKF